jgi:hypothetical protein
MHPARIRRSRRKLPQTPGNPRKATAKEPCIPGSVKTALSRRRSRVRVPSLP